MKKSIKINAFLNMVKQLCSVIFPLITVPYISRILDTDNYGKINYTTSIVNYFFLFSAFGVGNYTMREGSRKRENKVQFNTFANEVFSVNVLTTMIAYLAIIVMLIFIPELRDYKKLIIVQSLGIFFVTIGTDWINTVYEDFTYITIRYIIVQIVAIFCMFIFIHSANDYMKYAIITTTANVGANMFNVFYVRKYIRLRFLFTNTLKKHIVPMMTLLGNSLAVSIYVNSDIILLGIFQTDYEVGIYSIATKIYIIVKQLLNALIIVVVPRLSAFLGEGNTIEYNKLINKTFDSIISLLIPAIVGLYILSKDIVLLISGASYVQAGIPLKILSVSLGFSVLACFFSNCILLPYKKDKQFFFATLSACIVNIALNFAAIPALSYCGAAFTTLLAEFVVLILCFIQGRKNAKVIIKKKTILSIFFSCIGIICICTIVKGIIDVLFWKIVLSVMLSIIIYLCVMRIFKNYIVMSVIQSIRGKIYR